MFLDQFQFAGGSTGLRRRRAQIESGYGIQRPVGMGSTGGLRSTENIRVVISCAALNPRVMPGCTTGLIEQTANTTCPGRSSARPACNKFVGSQKLPLRAEGLIATVPTLSTAGLHKTIPLVPAMVAPRRKGLTATPSTQAYGAVNAAVRNLCRPAANLKG